MRAALFASRFHPHFGGVEEVVRQLAHQQQTNGDSPVVITNRWPKDLPDRDQFEGIPLRRHIFRVPDLSWKQLVGAALYSHSVIQELCREMREFNVDLINVHCVSSNAWYALQLRRRTKLPLVVTLHSELTMDATGLFQTSAFARGLMRDCLNRADFVTAVSQKTLEDAEAFLGRSLGTRARVIYNGVDIAAATQTPPYQHAARYILGIGRLAPQKGFDVLLRAFAAMKLPEIELIIAGDGEVKSSLESLALELGVGARVHFLGQVDRRTSLSLFGGCELLALPSVADEGLPMVVMEAMAAGCPVVATRVGGVPEAVSDRVNGILVDRGDVSAMSNAIREVLRDNTLRVGLGAGAQAFAQENSWSRISQQYSEAYQTAAESAKLI